MADRPESAVSPIAANAVANVAPAAATRRSQASAKPRPAPTQVPLIAATTGFGIPASAAHDRVVVPLDGVEPRARRRHCSASRVLAQVLPDAEPGARTGQHHGPHTAVRGHPGRPPRSSASFSSTVSALRRCGRFKVITATAASAASGSTRTAGSVTVSPLSSLTGSC